MVFKIKDQKIKTMGKTNIKRKEKQKTKQKKVILLIGQTGPHPRVSQANPSSVHWNTCVHHNSCTGQRD